VSSGGGEGGREKGRRQQTADSRQQTADSRQQTVDSRQQAADGRQQTADGRQQDLGDAILVDCVVLEQGRVLLVDHRLATVERILKKRGGKEVGGGGGRGMEGVLS
jgi:hypothetical protein